MTKNKSRPIVLLLSGLLWANLAQAQESVNTSGGGAAGSGGTVAYSVGQMFYTVDSNTSGTISQGVQQAYEIFTIGINETGLTLSLAVFPNPATDQLILQIRDYNNEKLSYQFCDLHGKLIYSGSIAEQLTQINTAGLPSATYFLQVVDQNNKQVQSFQIIKN